MIVKTVQEDILNSNAKHIAFAINAEGYNYGGLTEVICNQYWKELLNCGEHKLGTILSKKVGNQTFYALVCYSIKQGWDKHQAYIIKECFDRIPVTDELIDTVMIGNSLGDQMIGSKFNEIIYGMQISKQNILLHSPFTMEEIQEIYSNRNKKR